MGVVDVLVTASMSVDCDTEQGRELRVTVVKEEEKVAVVVVVAVMAVATLV